MKKIVVMPVKNEDWILNFSLSCSSLWADYIIVADQNSTDETEKICKSFKKVIYIKNDSEKFNENKRRQLLLDEVRKIEGNNLIFYLDADEVITSNILNEKNLKEITNNILPGQSILLQWINLWGTYNKYKDDNSIWSNNWKHFIFYDDRKYNYDEGFIHLSRIPEKYIENSIKIETIKILHYQFLDLNRNKSKQRYYRIVELTNNFSILSIIKINLKYYPTKIISNNGNKEIKQEWIELYKRLNIDFDDIKYNTNNYWFDKESLMIIKKYGKNYFKYLDIWDINWQKQADYFNIKGDFSSPITIFIKIYHKSQLILFFINKLIPQFIKNRL